MEHLNQLRAELAILSTRIEEALDQTRRLVAKTDEVIAETKTAEYERWRREAEVAQSGWPWHG